MIFCKKGVSLNGAGIFADSELSECQDTKTLDSVWLDLVHRWFPFPPQPVSSSTSARELGSDSPNQRL